MNIQKTNDAAAQQGIKLLVYGQAGAGKTRLCATVPDRSKAVILSAEAGLLSLRDYAMDYVVISSMADLKNAYVELRGTGHGYDWVCIDSASEIAEVCLSEEKRAASDPRKAYGELADKMFGAFRLFRDLPLNVYFSAKMGRVEDDGRQVHGPLFPGRQLEQGIAYLFDEVLVLHAVEDENGTHRYLQTSGDQRYIAKDRSGALDKHEKPSLAHVQAKILGVTE